MTQVTQSVYQQADGGSSPGSGGLRHPGTAAHHERAPSRTAIRSSTHTRNSHSHPPFCYDHALGFETWNTTRTGLLDALPLTS